MLAMIRNVRMAVILTTLYLSPGLARAQSGADTFATRCANCHGKDGAGKTAFAQKATVPDLRSAAIQSKTDHALHDSIGRGFNHKQYPHAYLMRGMTEGQLSSLISYIRTLKN